MHAATMAPIGVAALATLAGLFVVLDANTGDRRLVLSDMRTGVVLTAWLTVVVLAALLATAVSLAVAAAVFDAHQWDVCAAATIIVAITYGLLGVLFGPVLARSAAFHRLPHPLRRHRQRPEPHAARRTRPMGGVSARVREHAHADRRGLDHHLR